MEGWIVRHINEREYAVPNPVIGWRSRPFPRVFEFEREAYLLRDECNKGRPLETNWVVAEVEIIEK